MSDKEGNIRMEQKIMVKKRKILVVIVGLLLLGFIIRLFLILIPVMVSAPIDNQGGIENYNKAKIIEEYGKDIDSGLFLFPNQTEKMIEATFVSSFKTGLFDTDGYIILQAKYNVEDYEAEVERLSNVECSVRDEVLGVRYDTESYALPAYVAVDGFDYVYEYALIDQNNCKITYVLLSYPEDVDLNKYEEYLKLDRTEYTIKDTLNCFSIYVRQSKNDVYIEYSE